MKKMISILCIVLLLCSAMTMAVSAAAGTLEDPVVFAGRDFNMVKIPAGKTYYVSFTDANGMAKCQISVNSSTNKAAGYIVTYGETVQNSDENGYANITAVPDANGTYLLSITNNATKQATFFISYNEIAPWIISSTPLYEGENAVTTEMYDTTIYAFEAAELGIYEVTVDNKDAILSHWLGSPSYVAGLGEETTEGKLMVTCASVGQAILLGLGGVSEANITITKTDDYTPPAAIDYQEYQNVYTPEKGLKVPHSNLTEVDITVSQTVVLGSDNIYRYGSADGPILYVDMTGTPFADLYECYYPSSGGDPADRMRGTYLDADGNTCGFDFLNAMHQYADALDSEGFYFLTADIANYLNMFGKDQGWFVPEYSPFAEIQAGSFVDTSAWLINAYYAPASNPDTPADPEEPDTPADPEEPETPADPEEPETPADPEEPETPADPEEPETPADPEEPETPADPEEPETPADPEEPETPADPEEPDTPADPEEPDTPADPEEPETPADPEEPETPADPEEPDTPADPEEPDSPATGDMSTFGTMAALLLSSAGVLTFSKKRR